MPNALAASVPPAVFIGSTIDAQYLNNATPIPLANAATLTLPRIQNGEFAFQSQVLDISGFNTLSLFVTIADIVAGNTFAVTLATVDPQTGAALAGGLGDLALISETTNGSYATTVYLPAFYAAIVDDVLPFYQVFLVLSNTGGNAGTMHVTAFRLWLTNA